MYSNNGSLEQVSYPDAADKEVLKVYEFSPERLRVEVVSGRDDRVPKALDIEAKTMAMIGDPEEEVWAEFEPHNDSSFFFLAFETESQGSSDEILGMGREIPHSETLGNKTLTDLAIIPGWDVEGIEKSRVKNMSGQYVDAHDPESVVEAFCAEAECEDITKVWDISTLAPNFEHTDKIKVNVLGGVLLSAMARFGIAAWERDELTHVTAFNQEHAHGFFVDKLGYPFKNMFNLKPMVYDSFGSGEGMVAVPAWFALEDFASKIKNSIPSSYMGKLITAVTAESANELRSISRDEKLEIVS